MYCPTLAPPGPTLKGCTTLVGEQLTAAIYKIYAIPLVQTLTRRQDGASQSSREEPSGPYKGIVEATISKHDRLDILFNNVGIGLGGVGLRVTEEEWDAVMDTNLKGIVFLSKYTVPEMRKV